MFHHSRLKTETHPLHLFFSLFFFVLLYVYSLKSYIGTYKWNETQILFSKFQNTHTKQPDRTEPAVNNNNIENLNVYNRQEKKTQTNELKI